MKAAYKAKREKGIEIRDVAVPEISSNEVLIKVKKAAVCGTDIHLYEWDNWCENVKAKNPMIIGHEFCGEVVEVGTLENSTFARICRSSEFIMMEASLNMLKYLKLRVKAS